MAIKELYSFVEPRTGKESSLISDELYEFVKKNKSVIDGRIVQERDFDFDYFGFKTLERSYLLKISNRIVERPQYMYMRVALVFVMVILKWVLESMMIYHNISILMPHQPYSMGTRRPQMSSCFLIGNKGDDINGLFDTIKDVTTFLSGQVVLDYTFTMYVLKVPILKELVVSPMDFYQ